MNIDNIYEEGAREQDAIKAIRYKRRAVTEEDYALRKAFRKKTEELRGRSQRTWELELRKLRIMLDEDIYHRLACILWWDYHLTRTKLLDESLVYDVGAKVKDEALIFALYEIGFPASLAVRRGELHDWHANNRGA